MSTLKNHIAVITGAGSGIGKAIALGLAAEGATLCLLGRNIKALESVEESISSQHAHVKIYQVDLDRDDDIKRVKADLNKDFDHVNLLIHSAGVFSMGPLEHAPVEDFDQQFRINVRSPYLLTQLLLPMISSCQGQIVFINSSAGLNARENVSQYAATKHALKAIADSLRAEINDIGVRVISIYPGRTATPMQEKIHEMEGKPYHPERLIQPEDIAAVVVTTLSLPKSAEVIDITIRPIQNQTNTQKLNKNLDF